MNALHCIAVQCSAVHDIACAYLNDPVECCVRSIRWRTLCKASSAAASAATSNGDAVSVNIDMIGHDCSGG